MLLIAVNWMKMPLLTNVKNASSFVEKVDKDTEGDCKLGCTGGTLRNDNAQVPADCSSMRSQIHGSCSGCKTRCINIILSDACFRPLISGIRRSDRKSHQRFVY